MFGDDFLDTTLKCDSKNKKINKLDYIKIKSICSTKDTIKRMKRQVTDLEKMFAKHISDKGLAYKNIQSTLIIPKWVK